MAFDGGFLYKVLKELNCAQDSYIDKIYQPSKDELVFLLRKKCFVKRLYITIKSGNARVQFTDLKFENPTTPPNFCMLLRKYLSSAKLLCVTQPSLERVAEFKFSAANEMGDIETYRLVCELIGNQSNVILVRENGKIVDALKHSDVETAKRFILPGAQYEYPESTGKLNPLEESIVDKISLAKEDLSKKILEITEGFSPLVCREIELLSQSIGLENAFLKVIKQLLSGEKFYILFKPDGTPFEYSYIPITQYGNGYNIKEFSSSQEMLDNFYAAKENTARINAAAHDIIRLVKNLYSRTQKRLGLRLNELKKCENREQLRIYGELLKANLYRLKSGDEFAQVENYYDENMSLIKIPLNPALSPSKNADKYFKDYKKTYSAEQALTELTKKDREELLYFESVLESIQRCTALSEIAEIREELSLGGYIKRSVAKVKKTNEKRNFKEYISPDGYKISVGKNNIQNDLLTTKIASKNDLWFHTKDIPGSHVIVFCGGADVTDETVMFAAKLAAVNSKACNSAGVPVDYTWVKNVKKPNGAKPGMVIYTTNKTVYVTPENEGIL